LANKYARPDCLRRERGRFFDKPVGLDLASGVKNTEIPLRLKSNSQLCYDGIPLKGEEIIERYGRKKTTTPTGLIRHPGAKSIGGIRTNNATHCQYRTSHWQLK
jgi:hypothetical protein